MSTPIIMPRLGDFMTEGTITKIYKSSGDFVKQGEIIIEIETEKINYDLEGSLLQSSSRYDQIMRVEQPLEKVLEAFAPPRPIPRHQCINLVMSRVVHSLIIVFCHL